MTITAVNDAPVLLNNALTISEGGTVILGATEFSATDAETAAGTLAFSVSSISGGRFERVATPGVSITSFTQQEVTDGDVQFVHFGGEAAPTYSVTVSDGSLSDGPAAASITFTNVNDAPVITSDGGAATADLSVDENQTSVTTVTVTDADNGPTQTYSINGGADQGAFSIDDSSGDLEFKVSPDFESVADSDTNGVYGVTVRVTDASGATDDQAISVTVSNVDEPSVISGTFVGAVNEGDVGDAPVTTSGALSISDPDASDSPSFGDVGSTGGDNSYGSFTLTSGTWTYTLDQSAVQDLDAGETVTDTTTYTASDSSTQQITVTITGADDASVISGTAVGAVTEGDVGDAPVTTTGSISISDVDGDDSPSFADVATTSGDNSDGSFELTSGTWTYTLDQSAVQDLDAGETVTDTTTYTASDSTTQQITVTITGTDDASVITGTVVGAVTEGDVGDVPVTATGSIAISDVDSDDSPSFADVGWTVGDNSYGNFELTSGTWTYTLDQSAVQDLDAGETVTDTTTYTASDSSTQQITVTITGTDDASVITGTVGGAVTEGDVGDAPVTATGSIAISDVDGDDSPSFVDVAATSGDSNYGSFELTSGTWTYTLDQSAVQELDAGETVTDTKTYTASNSSTRQITVTIAGTDDASVITGTVTGSLAEGDVGNAPVTTTGSIAISDIDGDDSPGFADVGSTGGDNSYGNFKLTGGTWTYTLDQGAVQNLNDGDSVADTITYTSTDGSTQQITVTILGSDDAPRLTSSSTSSIAENSVEVMTVTSIDVDDEATQTYSVSGGVDRAAFEIDANSGALTFLVAPSYEEKSHYEVEVTVTDNSALSDSQLLTVMVDDINEAPVSVDDKLASEEDTVRVIDIASELLGNDADPEGGALRLVELTAPVHGTLVRGAEGTLEYRPDANFNGTDRFEYIIEDASGLRATASVVVDIAAVNDPPTFASAPAGEAVLRPGVIDASRVSVGSMPIEENVGVAGLVEASDVDDAAVRFSLAGADATLFEIDRDTGALRPRVPLDFEAPTDADGDNRYELELVVSDAAGAESRVPFTLLAVDVNEAPLLGGGAFDAIEGYNGVIGQLSATDPDRDDVLAFELVDGSDDAGAFSLLSDGQLVAVNPSTGVHVLEVRVTDAQGMTSIATVTVTVRPIDDGSGEPQLASAQPIELSPMPLVGAAQGGAEPSTNQAEEPLLAVVETVPETDQASIAQESLAVPLTPRSTIVPAAVETARFDVAVGLQWPVHEGSASVALDPIVPIRIDLLPIDLELPEQLPPRWLEAAEWIRRDLDALGDQIEANERLITSITTVASVSISVGAAFWLLQSRLLIAAALAALPLWRPLDPVPILIANSSREGRRSDTPDSESPGSSGLFGRDQPWHDTDG